MKRQVVHITEEDSANKQGTIALLFCCICYIWILVGFKTEQKLACMNPKTQSVGISLRNVSS